MPDPNDQARALDQMLRFLRAVADQPVAGGCDDCQAVQSIHERTDGVVEVSADHQGSCPSGWL